MSEMAEVSSRVEAKINDLKTEMDHLSEKFHSRSFDKPQVYKDSLAADFHRGWYQNYISDPENYEDKDIKGKLKPRWRDTDDTEWVEKMKREKNPLYRNNNGQDQADIAVEDINRLPENRAKENRDAASVAVDLILEYKNQPGDILDSGSLADIAAKIHEKWMERNSWAKKDAPQKFLPFHELSDDEKVKDMEQVIVVMRKLVGMGKKASE